MAGSPDAERVERMRTSMAAEGLDGLILRLPENIVLLGGTYPLTGLNFLLFPRDGEPMLLVPQSEAEEASDGWWSDIRTFEFGTLSAGNPYEQIQRVLRSFVSLKGKSWKRIGYEGSFEFVAPALLSGEGFYPAKPTEALFSAVFEQMERLDCTDLLHRERATKTEREIAKLQIANRIAEIGLAKFAEVVVPGKTEGEIAGLVVAAIMKDGVGSFGPLKVQAFPQVTSGPEHTAAAWRPCVISTDRILREGDLAILELGVVADGFWADVTRTRVAGVPSARQKELFDVVRSAQEAAEGAAAVGVKCADVDRAARAIIEKAGLGEYFVHVTGHGIGFRYHEPSPTLHPDSDEVLQAGMVFSVEPGIYLPGFGGIRIENDVALTQTGKMVLTTFDKRLS
ncbi:MAG: Xaa-Pro peptidase family protein [Candidatus Latescibacterota bacterium]